MEDKLIVDPEVKDLADRARHGKNASLMSARLVSASTNKAIEELIQLIGKSHGGKHGN